MDMECPRCGVWIEDIEDWDYICPYCNYQIIDDDCYVRRPVYNNNQSNNNRNRSNNNKHKNNDNMSIVIA